MVYILEYNNDKETLNTYYAQDFSYHLCPIVVHIKIGVSAVLRTSGSFIITLVLKKAHKGHVKYTIVKYNANTYKILAINSY